MVSVATTAQILILILVTLLKVVFAGHYTPRPWSGGRLGMGNEGDWAKK